MRLDKTGLLMMLALIFAAKLLYHLFSAALHFIVYEVCALLVNVHNFAVNKYNDRQYARRTSWISRK